MKGAFKLLETRSLYDNIDLSLLEEKINRSLPPLYKTFLTTFFVDDKSIEKQVYRNYYYNFKETKEEDFRLSYCSTFRYNQLYKSVKYPNSFIVFDFFIDPEMSINVYIEELEYGNDKRMENMLCIGSAGPHAGIYVSLEEEKMDNIFFIGENDMYFIANDIFEFVRGIEFISNAEDPTIMQDVPYDKLYRNWGEDFWRVREDEKPA